jgi:hypothetical protein
VESKAKPFAWRVEWVDGLTGEQPIAADVMTANDEYAVSYLKYIRAQKK